MNERDFFYWLRGFFELTDSKTLDKQQVKMIKEHMDLVSMKVTPTHYSYTIANPPNSNDPAFVPAVFGPRPSSDPYKVEITCNSPSAQEGKLNVRKIDPVPFTENQWGLIQPSSATLPADV